MFHAWTIRFDVTGNLDKTGVAGSALGSDTTAARDPRHASVAAPPGAVCVRARCVMSPPPFTSPFHFHPKFI